MATFLDLYINLIGFVNYKLYCDTNLIYPPKLDSTRDARGAGLESFILESVKKPQLVAANSSVDENGAVMSATEKKKQKV